VTSLNIARFGDYQLSYISGVISRKKNLQAITGESVEDSVPEQGKTEETQEENEEGREVLGKENDTLMTDAAVPGPDESTEEKKDFILDVARSENVKFHKPVMIGDVRLSEFQSLLNSRGFSTEFSKGVLIVNGRVTVKKEGHNLRLEGGINADYFSVRRLLYESHAII
jgi:hypothetical protein